MIQLAKNLELWPIERLKPYERNARTHSADQIEKLCASIIESGFNNPILVDATDGIIAGHGRLAAAKQLGMPEVPVVVLTHLSDTQRRAYILADNKLQELGGWDREILAQELEALKAEDFDLGSIGFSDEELERSMVGFLPEDPMPAADGALAQETLPDAPAKTESRELEPEREYDPREDEAPEAPEATTAVTIGDLFILGDHRILCGDSTDQEDVERLMAGDLADLVFTDPPYGVAYEGGATYGKTNSKVWEGIIGDTLKGEALTDLFAESMRCAESFSKDHAAFYIWYAAGKSVETYRSFAELNLQLRAVICWYKRSSGAFMSQYIPVYEPCMYAHKRKCSPRWFGPSNEKTVWEVTKASRNEFHPTQKPVELPDRALRNSSQPGDIVLDLFGGSGSTLISCEGMGRKARMMELDPRYVHVIIDRWEAVTGKQAVREDGVLWRDIKDGINAATVG